MANVKHLHTRFLWPFFISGDQFDHVEAVLGSDWIRQQPPHLYRDELLEQALAFLCEDIVYFRFADAASFFPQALTATLSKGVTVPVKIPSGGGIELFVTREGIGVLSIMLSVADVPTDTALDFNYRLARKSGAPPATLHVTHPSENAARWSRIPEADRSKIRSAPALDATARDRIGAPGGTFTLAEVVEHLIAPLVPPDVRDVQKQLSVYTVALFGDDVVFDQESCVSWGGPFLSALAQIEEPTHAGAKAGAVDVPSSLMNRCHWAAVGVLGAAHLTADQPPLTGAEEHPFNAERMYRIRDKYFVPYLLALIQRHVLNRMADEAVDLVRSRDAEKLRALRTSLLEFGIGGRLSQVSSRQAVHRYYRLVQEGLDLREAWGDVRNALSDIDESNIATNVANNVGAMTRLQHAAHALEYVIISVYSAKLWHMFAEGNESLYKVVLAGITPLLPHDRTLPHDWFIAWGVLLFAGLGWLFVYLYNHFRSGHEHSGR